MSEPQDDAPSSAGNTLVQVVLHGLWRYRLLLLVAIAIGGVIGLFRALVIPNEFRSIGKLFVRPGVRDQIAPEAVFPGAGGAARVTGIREAVQNELQILTIPELFDKIVEQVGVDVVMAPYDPTANHGGEVAWHTAMFHAFQAWWFASGASAPRTDIAVDRAELASLMLERTVYITPETGANVIAIEYVSHSPERARVIVNAALMAAMELHGEVFDKMTSISAMEKEATNAEATARAAENKLREFRGEKGVYDFEAQTSGMIEELADIDRQIKAIDVDTTSFEAEQAELQKVMESVEPQRLRVGSEAVVVNPAYEQMQELLREARMALFELEFSSPPTAQQSDFYKDRRSKAETYINNLETTLDQTDRHLKLEGVKEENPAWVEANQRLRKLAVDLVVAKTRRAELAEQLERTRQALRDLEALTPTLREYELDARQKRESADRLARGVTDLRNVQRLEQLNLSNISVMHYGTLEATKIAPQRGKMVVFAAFGGGAVGAVLVVLLTLLDRRVRIREDLQRLGVPGDGIVADDPRPPVLRADWTLPHSLAGIREEIAKFWAALPYDRRAAEGLRVAFLPGGDGAEAGRAAAALAVGLAAHGGERVVYVASAEGPTWLAQRLGLAMRRGWSEVLRGEVTLAQAQAETPIPGLTYLSAGAVGNAVPHPMAGPGFVALLDELAGAHRFVIVELPDLGDRPEARSVLGVVDAALVVVRRERTAKATVRDAIRAVHTAGARLLGAVLQGPERQPPEA